MLKQHNRQHRGLSKLRRESYLAWYVSIIINHKKPTRFTINPILSKTDQRKKRAFLRKRKAHFVFQISGQTARKLYEAQPNPLRGLHDEDGFPEGSLPEKAERIFTGLSAPHWGHLSPVPSSSIF